MSDIEQLLLPTVMPEDWATTSVVRYVDDPFSEEALGETDKTWIDLGPIDVDRCDTIRGGRIKVEGEVDLASTMPVSSPAMISAHQLFLNASRLILGERRFKGSEIDLTKRYSEVEPGSRQVGGRPHVDGYQNYPADFNFLKNRSLRLVGLACNVLPTILLNGATTRKQLYDSGDLVSIGGLNKRFSRMPIPTGRLILIPPAMLHDSMYAPSDVDTPIDRRFLRWHLRV